MPGVLLRLHGFVQFAQHKHAQLLVLQQAAHFLHVEPADALAVQDALHHLLQELLVLTAAREQGLLLVCNGMERAYRGVEEEILTWCC